MAIFFYQKKKKQLYLALLAVILIAVLIFIWLKYIPMGKGGVPLISSESLQYREKKIQVDFEKLENALLRDLQPFTPVSSPGFELGRDNPFAPYDGEAKPLFSIESISP